MKELVDVIKEAIRVETGTPYGRLNVISMMALAVIIGLLFIVPVFGMILDTIIIVVNQCLKLGIPSNSFTLTTFEKVFAICVLLFFIVFCMKSCFKFHLELIKVEGNKEKKAQ